MDPKQSCFKEPFTLTCMFCKNVPQCCTCTDGPEHPEEWWISAIRRELICARSSFPGRDRLLAAFVEEVGEVANALLENGSGTDEVRAEAVQACCVAIRIAEEGCPEYE
jgi:hypothetical protein